MNKLYKYCLGKYSQKPSASYSQQRKTERQIPTHGRPFIKKQNFHVYSINITQALKMMYKIKNSMTPQVFEDQFRELEHKHPTKYSQASFYCRK